MNVLPKPGVYQIAVRTKSKKPYDLAITLLDPHDPRLDPGVTPDQVSLDLGAFPSLAKPGSSTPAAMKEVARRLAAASPDSFRPSLAQLDAVSLSLRLP